jgi:phosphoribosylaminoimidazole carboxylase PurE protein
MVAQEKNAQVAIVMGSDSDLETMESCINELKGFEIKPIVRIISAHRTPEAAAEFASTAASKGVKVIIAAAGMAAHLAGAMAAKSHLPIIGVPMQAKEGPCGLDALLSTVQMPPGVPVASMAIGKAGAKNAAVFAAQILALSDKAIEEKLLAFRTNQTKKALEKDAQVSSKY